MIDRPTNIPTAAETLTANLTEGWRRLDLDAYANDDGDSIDDRDEYRTRIEFARDDMGDWHAIVQHDGSGHGYMHGTAAWTGLPEELNALLDTIHDRYKD